MLKKRFIPKFLIRGSRLVKGVRFHENFREAGNPVTTAKVYDAYGVDELLFLDIDATPDGRAVTGSIIERVSEEVFMPFTVGGGVRSLGQVASLLRSGAASMAGAPTATRGRFTANGVPAASVIRYVSHLYSLNNRPALKIKVKAGTRLGIVQL